ncbi:fimbria/pilus outer membrane usher protein [[Enterobacter] lignolyticus]|uniref:Fimbrial protein n=1 Tax=[Enterobacter] lignolyticus TaxID=1334193 RepID=A0A806XEY8_9ENTR|nr:fimbria/pilus outer membrane usher protein [[Enterobacter] lignolyticus]ALR77349.1 fimbrial protein [[Enterobacter] lignolyticus]
MTSAARGCWGWLLLSAGTIAATEYTFDASLFLGSGYENSLAQFNQQNAIAEGRYSVDVWLNGQFVERLDVLFRKDSAGDVAPCLPADFWQAQGLTSADEQGEACLTPRERVSGGDWQFDQGALRLQLSVPQAALKRTPVDYVPPAQWQSGENVVFSNYNLNVYHNKNAGRESDYGWLGLNSGINLGTWQFRQQSSANWRRENGRESQQWDALQTWLQRPIAGLGSLLTVGESYTPGNLLGSMAFTGVKLETDQRMWPQSRRGYAPEIRGTASTPSRVVVTQNGRTLYETSVPQGPFILDDLPNTAWDGDLQVEITGADGKKSGYTVPYASVPLSLRPGVWRYGAVVGKTRDYHASDSLFADFTLERGVANMLTTNGAVRIGDGYQALLIGGVLATRLGAFGADVTGSHARTGVDDLRGWRMQSNWSRTFTGTGTHVALAGYRYSTQGYRDYGDVLGERGAAQKGRAWRSDTLRQRNQFTATVNQTLGGLGNLWLSGSMMDYYGNRGSSSQLQAGYNTTVGRVTLGLALSRQDTWWLNDLAVSRRQQEDVATLTISLPLAVADREHTLSLSGSRSRQAGSSAQMALSGSLDAEETLNYAVSTGWQQGSGGAQSRQDWSGTLQKNTAFGTLNGSVSQAPQYQQWAGGVRGAVVVHSHGVVAGPWVGDTFALVEAPGASGARVGGGQGARVNDQGYALVPSLTPYRYNTVTLDGQEMTSQVELQESQRRVAPLAGAAVKLRFSTLSGFPLLISVRDAAPFPPGLAVRDEQGNVVGMSAQGNQLYARVGTEKGRLTLEGSRCVLPWTLNDAQREQPLIALTLACQPQGSE